MTRALAVALVVLVGCSAPVVSSATPSPTPFATSSATMIAVPRPTSTPRTFVPTPGAKPLEGGCGQTTVLQGGLSQPLIDATGNNAPPTPYAIARPASAAAFPSATR